MANEVTPITAKQAPRAQWVIVKKVRGGFIVAYDEVMPSHPQMNALAMMAGRETERREIIAPTHEAVAPLLRELLGE